VANTLQYNTIQYKTYNAPYVSKMLFVDAGMLFVGANGIAGICHVIQKWR